MRTNTAAPKLPVRRTFNGAVGANISPMLELRRTVCACMLFEETHYESGTNIAQRIAALVAKLASTHAAEVADLAREARGPLNLRHVPLFLVRELARNRVNVQQVLFDVIQRPDEISEFVALYWKDGKQPLAASVKRGLAGAFGKFSEYSLAKYDQDSKAIKLRDVAFMVHALPHAEDVITADESTLQQSTGFYKPMIANGRGSIYWRGNVLRHGASLLHRLIHVTMATPDTWETELSKSTDKLASWNRLLDENKLGALALLRNLRNMTQAGVSMSKLRGALQSCKPDRVLPFRFITAAQHAPTLEPELETLMFQCVADRPKLTGRTLLLVDGSQSMFDAKVSAKSDMRRFDAACALAMLCRETCDDVQIVIFGTEAKLLPPRRGFALRDVLQQAAQHGGTYLHKGLEACKAVGYDRIIVFTDEQASQAATFNPEPLTLAYMVNIATNAVGVGYGDWLHVDGFSEAIVDFIHASEQELTD